MMASHGQWGPDSLKEALNIMSELLRHGYNPAGIVREGVNVDVVRTCCKHLGIPFIEEDLLRADAERRGAVYIPSPRASVDTTRRTASASVGGGSMLRDDIELGGSALNWNRTSPSAGPSTQPPPPASLAVGTSSRKRKDRDAPTESEIIIISDSSDDSAIATSGKKTKGKGKQVDRGPSNWASTEPNSEGASRNRRVVDYTDTEAGRAAPHPRPPQERPADSRPQVQGIAHPSAPPPPRTAFFSVPPPGQRLTKGQKKARRREYDRQLEMQRQAGITFEPPPPLPPNYVRPLENAPIESAVYKPSNPDAVVRPVPSWLRGQGSDSAMASLPESLPPRPIPVYTQRQSDKQKEPPQRPPQPPKKGRQSPVPVLRPAVPRATAPSPAPPRVESHGSATETPFNNAHDERANRHTQFGGDASVDSTMTVKHESADVSFQSAHSQPKARKQTLLQRIGSAIAGYEMELSPERSGSENGDATFVDAPLPPDGISTNSAVDGTAPAQTLAPPEAPVDDTESEYEPTYEPEYEEEPSTSASHVPFPGVPVPQDTSSSSETPQIVSGLTNTATMSESSLESRLLPQIVPEPTSPLASAQQSPQSNGTPQSKGTPKHVPGEWGKGQSKTAKKRALKRQKALEESRSSDATSGAPVYSGDQNLGVGSTTAGANGFSHQQTAMAINPLMNGVLPIPGMSFGYPRMNPAQSIQAAPLPTLEFSHGSTLPPPFSSSTTTQVKQEPGSPPMPVSNLSAPPAAGDAQGNLAKMREAALASMLGKRKKAVAPAASIPSISMTTPAEPMPPATSVPGEDPSTTNAVLPQMEADAPRQSETVIPHLDYNQDEAAIDYSDSGILMSGPSLQPAVGGRKQVSYADAFPDRSSSSVRARRKETADMGIPTGDLDLDLTDPSATVVASAPGQSAPAHASGSGAQGPPSGTASWRQKRGRPTAADFFEGFQYGADRARAPWVRRGPFLKVSDWQQRSYGTITLDEETSDDESDDEEGTASEAGEGSSKGAARTSSPENGFSAGSPPSWTLQGPALRKHHLHEVDGIVEMLRSGNTPTLSQLRSGEAGPARVPLLRTSSLGALRVPSPVLSPAAGSSGEAGRHLLTKSATQKIGTDATTSKLSIAVPSQSGGGSLSPSAVGTPTGAADQQAEMKAKLATYEASLREMKEQMAKFEEMRAKQKAMEIAQKRRAASRAPNPDSDAQDALAELTNGAEAATKQPANEGGKPDGPSATSHSLISNGRSEPAEIPAASSTDQSLSKPDDDNAHILQISPGSEPQDGEEYIPEDDSFMLDLLGTTTAPAAPTQTEPPVTGQDQQMADVNNGPTDSSSRWTPYVSPLTTFPALRRLADGRQ
ncbi:hypothetical protein A4X13_0g446 [Tilletia indica]|uniref:Uncharacterized protein n=1 Tax=Tilletia indica TaxID=43049 RepID=A0A177TL87_9BASI|nr:hypothetical protein A4X13_0g446 [Tilletia indica]